MRKRIFAFLLLVFLISVFILLWKSLPIISGYAAKVACSGVFVAGRPADSVLKNDLAYFPVSLASCKVNLQDSSVTASVLGLASRKAIYRWGLGATLVTGISEETIRGQRMIRALAPVVNADTVDWPQGDKIRDDAGGLGAGEPASGGSASGRARRLEEAVGQAFESTGTRAVVVVWHGRLVLERYAPGFDRHTRLLGWSMTKGILNTLAGVLFKQGRLDTAAPAPVASWQGDERRQITIAELMHMNSGLRWWEFYGGPSDATSMLFKEADMADYAGHSGLKHPPGQVFNYSSGTANILSGIIRRTVGDEYYYRFPYEQLFYKTGMYSAVMEPDASGTFVGSSYCYATARDWARFGLLYLHDGVWNGSRILPEGWVRWTATGTNYGALWWLNKDCYYCDGYEGQYIWVVPSSDLVVVRLAMEHGRRLDRDRFLSQVINALK